MLPSAQALVTLFEEGGLTVEQIAQAEGQDVMAVKTILMQYSVKYRKLMRTGSEEDKQALKYTPSEQEDAKRVLHSVMLEQESEDPHLAVKCAMFIRDDGLGRKDRIPLKKNMGINITMIQQAFINATQVLNKTREEEATRVIDIPAKEQKLLREQVA